MTFTLDQCMKMNNVFSSQSRVAIFSDLHLGVHSDSESWYGIADKWSKWCRDTLKQNNIRDIIFMGDWFHNRADISVNTLHIAMRVLQTFDDFNIHMITGNHDVYFRHRTDVHSLSIFKGRSNVMVYDQPTTLVWNGKKERILSFLPWGFDTTKIVKSDAIFGHLEIESFMMNAFKMCDHGLKISDLLSLSPLIFSGHFHIRREKVLDNGTIIYVGNPFEMDFGDVNNVKGLYLLDLETMQYEFIKNNITPRHQYVDLSQLVSEGDITDKTISWFANNIVKLKIDKNISTEHLSILLTYLNTLKPFTLLIENNINVSHREISTDLSGVDISQAIEEFITMLDIDNREKIIQYTQELYRKAKNEIH